MLLSTDNDIFSESYGMVSLLSQALFWLQSYGTTDSLLKYLLLS